MKFLSSNDNEAEESAEYHQTLSSHAWSLGMRL